MSGKISKVGSSVKSSIKRVMKGGQHNVYAPSWDEEYWGESQSHFSVDGTNHNDLPRSRQQGNCRDKARKLLTGKVIVALTLVVGIFVTIIVVSTPSSESEDHLKATPAPSPATGNLGDLDLNYLPKPKDPRPSPSPSILDTSNPDTRRQSIFERLETLSGTKVRRKSTAQHIAADWIIESDPLQLEVSSPYLIQRYVVALIYFAMGGRYAWKGVSDWVDGTSECQWTGIECNKDNFITKIELEKVGLTGYIPKEMAGLSHLMYLNWSQNNIFGSIPNDFGMMESLQSLYLDKNDLNGNVENAICELREKGTLEEFTTDCGKIDFKIRCDCCTNCPKSVSSEPSQIHANTDVYVDNPHGLDMHLMDNEISGILEMISGENLYVHDSPQNKAYAWIIEKDLLRLGKDSPNLVQRYVLALMYFQLSGEFWKKTSWLSPDNNECTYEGITCDEYSRVIEIDLSGTLLSGHLPTEVSKLSYLKKLNLSFNNVSGGVPKEWGALMQLEYLSLKTNALQGTVPVQVCALKKERLQIFDVDCGKLSCDCCTNCMQQTVATSTFTTKPLTPAPVSAPVALSSQEELLTQELKKVSYWADNSPDSPRKKAIHWLATVDTLHLGVSDPKLVQRYVMVLLYFSLNGDEWTIKSWLSGGISECEWKGVTCSADGNIIALILTSVNLRGMIPYELEQLIHLKILDLSSNRITGAIPEELQNISSLSVLKLFSNELIGQVPDGICMLKEMGSISEIWVDCASNDRHKITCSSQCCTKCGISGLSKGHPPIHITTTKPTMQPTKFDPFKVHACPTDGTNDRAMSIVEKLITVSVLNKEELNLATEHTNSPRYNALDWLVEKDELQLGDCQDNLKQRYILAVLFFSMNGTQWVHSSDWLNGKTFECQWEGITCDEKGHVKAISLKEKGLDGIIPYELASLPNLRALDMSNNIIRGHLPEEFKNLSMLEILILYNNHMSGSVSDLICELKDEGSLKFLWMDCEKDASYPVSCSCCTKCGPAS